MEALDGAAGLCKGTAREDKANTFADGCKKQGMARTGSVGKESLWDLRGLRTWGVLVERYV